MKTKSSPLLPLPQSLPDFLATYLPSPLPALRPFVTLTYAQSIDARIAAAPGTRTAISHAETKTMTHYLRAHHDAILIGSGTVLADDPGLNCRLFETGTETGGLGAGAGGGEKIQDPHPRPIIVDPSFKWSYKGSKMETLALEELCKEPWIFVREDHQQKEKEDYLVKRGGKVFKLPVDSQGQISWDSLLVELKKNAIDSVMIEGGARVINTLLGRPDLVDSLIVTVGPVYLGSQGVSVSPPSSVQLRNITWWTGIQDSVMAATLIRDK